MEKHYVCQGGCGGVAETPGVCQAEHCPDHGKPLQECICADGLHGQAKEQDTQAPEGQAGDM